MSRYPDMVGQIEYVDNIQGTVSGLVRLKYYFSIALHDSTTTTNTNILGTIWSDWVLVMNGKLLNSVSEVN